MNTLLSSSSVHTQVFSFPPRIISRNLDPKEHTPLPQELDQTQNVRTNTSKAGDLFKTSLTPHWNSKWLFEMTQREERQGRETKKVSFPNSCKRKQNEEKYSPWNSHS